MSWELVFPEAELDRLRRELLSQAPDEGGAILRCSQGGSGRLLVEHIDFAGPADYDIQTPVRLAFSGTFTSRSVKAAREAKQSLLLVHTHPFTDAPQFSAADDDGERHMMPALRARVPGVPHGALVLGTNGFEGRVYDGDKVTPIDQVVQVGPAISITSAAQLWGDVGEIYDRNVLAFGEQGQRRLRSLKVAIVGLGGTGSLVCEQLAHLGLGYLLLIDPDHLAETNLNRVVGARPADVGRPKVDIAHEHATRISDDATRVEGLVGDVVTMSVASRLLECDVVFCCTDSHGSRAVINQLAYQYLLPAFDMGVRIDASDGVVRAMSGRLQMLAPGLACLQCQALLDPEQVRVDLLSQTERTADPYIVGAQIAQPAIISLNGTVASLTVTMFLAATVGLPSSPRRLNYRITEGTVRSVSSTPNPNCIVCSATRGSLAKGGRWPMIWREA